MNLKRLILGSVVALALMPGTLPAADGQPAERAAGSTQDSEFPPVLTGGLPRAPGEPLFLGQWGGRSESEARFGWWGVSHTGRPNKVGEYQSLESSPFWDFDHLSSDGCRTVDLFATGTDDETSAAGLYFYGKGVTARIGYDRYIHRLDRDEAINFIPSGQPGPYSSAGSTYEAPGNPLVISRDRRDVGEEYAIRVQELDARFKGTIGDNLKWRLNVWGMKKTGDRQTVAVAHCYRYRYNVNNPDVPVLPLSGPAVPPNIRADNTCHMVTQRQTIDWLTQEVEPVLETKIGAISIEYSRPMRQFAQGDSIVTRNYSQSGHASWISPGAGDVPYAVVPDNFTQIDKLKISADLTETDKFYAYLMSGDTENRHRDTHRSFNLWDLRLTDTTFEGFSVTGYAKRYRQTGQLPPDAGLPLAQTFEGPILQGPSPTYAPPGDPEYVQPINYTRTSAGIKGRWKPYESGWSVHQGLSFNSGYEYSVLDREHAEYEFGTGEFHQPSTVSNLFTVGSTMKWNPCWETFASYKLRINNNPLYGIRVNTADVNTMLPTNQNSIDLGFTWYPTSNFLLSASFGIENRYHRSLHQNLNANYGRVNDDPQTVISGQTVNVGQTGAPLLGRPLPNPRETEFNENNYPIVVTAWWAPTCKWSLTGGYATFSNYIDQLITLGDEYNDGIYRPASAPPLPSPYVRNYVEADAYQSTWQFRGRSHVVDFGGGYDWTERVRLTGGVQYIWGENITVPRAPAQSYGPLKTAGAPNPNGNPPNSYVIHPDPTLNPPALAPDWSNITPGSDIINETWRLTAGVDYLLSERITSFFRYSFYKFGDFAGNEANGQGGNGIAHMFLGGLSASF